MQTCPWCYIGIVPVLRGVAAGYDKCLFLYDSIGSFDAIHLILVGEIFLNRLFYICHFTPMPVFGKLFTYPRIEAHTASTKKSFVIGLAVIDVIYYCIVENTQCPYRIERYPQMARQTVSRANGNNTQRRIGMYQRTGYFVTGTISSDRYDKIISLFHGFAGKLGSMTSISGKNDFGNKNIFIESILHPIRHILLGMRPRNRIHDKQYFLALHLRNIKEILMKQR